MQSLKNTKGYSVIASGGKAGTVEDYYIDPGGWVVRYVVVDGGEWLNNRRVLIAPIAVQEIDNLSKELRLTIDLARVQASPDFSLAKPLNRQNVIELHEYYQWPAYWNRGEDLEGSQLAAYPLIDLAAQMANQGAEQSLQDTQFITLKEISGYSIQARDGEIGSVDDFIIEDETWRIVYMIVATGNWMTGKNVVLSPSWIENVDWPASKVVMDLKRETIEKSPEYDPSTPIDRSYETRLYDHYGRKKDQQRP